MATSSGGAAVKTIFVSYRREDTPGHAGRLCDRLRSHFREARVFMDVDTIQPGVDFVHVIEEAVASCDVLLALIGDEWLTVKDALGTGGLRTRRTSFGSRWRPR